MSISVEMFISLAAAVITLLLLIFAVDWRYFRDWVVVYLFKSLLDFVVSSPTVELQLLEYPDRLLPNCYDTCCLNCGCFRCCASSIIKQHGKKG